MKSELTAERLRELLDYDPTTGVFTQRIQHAGRSTRWKPGRIVGHLCKQSGYLTLRLDKKLYQAHRVAWFYVQGEWPKQQIDHINGDRTDNRIANLRDVPNTINRQNTKQARADSSTRVQGVQFDRRRHHYYSQIRHAGRIYWLGTFATAEEARAAYTSAKLQLHPGWAPPAGEQIALTDNHLLCGQGRQRVRCDSGSGVQGVQRRGHKWLARYKRQYLGMFATPEEARAAYEYARNGGGLRV